MNEKLKNYIYKHIKNLGIRKNDNILVYSDLSKFGISNKNLPKIIIYCLKKIIGKKGTIIMPFYFLEMPKNFIFDKNKFIFTKHAGNLTRIFIKEKKIIRSKALIHNHVGIGPKAKILNYSNENISIGKNSDFEHIKNSDFKLLLLGCDPLQGATYLHHLEAIYKVPYRKWIKVKKKVLKNNVVKTVSVNYFAKKNKDYISNFNEIFKRFYEFNFQIYKKRVKYGSSLCLKLRSLNKAGLKLLKENNYAFVKRVK